MKSFPPNLTLRGKALRQSMTPAEKRLWKYLQAKRFQHVKFRRQHQVGSYIADFYCDSARLIIELQGKIHLKRKEYDEERFAILRASGYKVLRIGNDEVLTNLKSVLKKICSCLPEKAHSVIRFQQPSLAAREREPSRSL